MQLIFKNQISLHVSLHHKTLNIVLFKTALKSFLICIYFSSQKKNKNPNYETFFLLATFFLSFICNAQLKEKFEKGWIVNDKDLKIEGYIRADDLSKLSSDICFKQNLDVKKCQFYSTTELKSFKIGKSNTFELVKFKINNKQQEVELFLNLIIKGNVLSLYKGIFKSETFYVVSKKGKNYVLQNDKLVSGETEVKRYNFGGILNLITEGLAQRSNKKIKFNEDYFVETVTEYNVLKKSKVTDLRSKEKTENFILPNISVGFEDNGIQYYGQVMYRKYQPKISRSTSLNLGINYFYYKFKSQNRDLTQSLLSLPIQIQQNILNKNVRPYIFAGFSFFYSISPDKNNNSIINEGFQKPYGLNPLYGAGIEIDILKGIYLKSEYRVEPYAYPLMFGIGYIYKIN